MAVVLQAGFWAHAENVTTAAAQEAARAASAQGSDLTHGLQVGNALLEAGLGPSAQLVRLRAREDDTSVTVEATGGWPLGVGFDAPVLLPLDATVRVQKQVWVP